MEKRLRAKSPYLRFAASALLKQFFLILFLILWIQKGQAQCPISGYTYLGAYNGHAYYLSNAGVNPSQAYPLSEALGGYLASITSAGENSWLAARVPNYITIGLNDLASEGNFVWHSGEALSYTNWWPGEPNNSGNEDYVVINFGATGRWNDVPNWVQPRFVVEFDDLDPDSDGDGALDCNDGCPNDANKTAPGQCGCGVADTDTDSDGTADCNDGCPTDANKTAAGICGCGVADTDTDGDGTADCNDGCPLDPAKTEAGICGCGVADTDSDGDGTADCNDGCPNDANKIAPGQCGCGNADTDSDCDGIADCNDVCPGGDDSVDNNGDNIPDCSQLLSYEAYSSAWKCAPNKIRVCHVGDDGPESLCISKNALAAHYNHGDKVGPCISCGNSLKTVTHDTDEEDGHDHDGGDVSSEILKIVPNPVSDHAEIWLEGLNEPGMITLMDLNGKTIWQTRFAAGQKLVTLDAGVLQANAVVYLVRLVSGKRSISKYLAISR